MGGKKEAKEKPLEKMTSKELRELAFKIPEITGVHGMNKEELLSKIKKSRGIKEDTAKAKGSSAREIKQQIKKLKAAHSTALDSDDKKMAGIYRKRIVRLKKKSRRLAA